MRIRFEGPDGRLWMVYHQQSTERVGWDRFLAPDLLWLDDEGGDPHPDDPGAPPAGALRGEIDA